MVSLEVQLLGPLSVKLAGHEPPADLLWKKNAGLLVYLICSPNRSRSREHLIGLLWADKSDSAARQSMREALRILRKGLGANSVVTDRDDVNLNLGHLQTDISRFGEVERDDPVHAMDQIRGEFLEGFFIPNAPEFEGWLEAQRLEWRRRVYQVCVRLTQSAMQSGDNTSCGRWAMRGLAVEPGSDVLVRLGMRSFAVAGDRGAAVDLYERFVSRMADLDLVPEEETESLCHRIQHERNWSATAQSGDPRGIRRAPLVGRTKEIAESISLWRACVAHDRLTVIAVEADVGFGKTRLAEQAMTHARLDGAFTMMVRGVEGDEQRQGIGLLTLADAGLADAPGIVSSDPGRIAAFAGVLPAWASRFPASISLAAGSLEEAMSEALRAALVEQPVFVLLDDAHLLDAETLRATQRMIRDLSGNPLLVWVNVSPLHRRHELDTLRSTIGRDVAGTNLALRPLTSEDVTALVGLLMPELPHEQRERLARRITLDAGGIPLLTMELIYAVEYGMALEEIPEDWPQPNRTLSQTRPGDLPKATVLAIRVAFRTLSLEAQEVVRVAAVINSPITIETLSLGINAPLQNVLNALDELEWHRWFETDGRGYTFVARLVREIILQDMLTPGQRRRIWDLVSSVQRSESLADDAKTVGPTE